MSVFVGLPVDMRELDAWGIEATLDRLEQARVNRIMLKAYDPTGCFFRFDRSFLAFTRLEPSVAPSVPAGTDPLADVCEAAAKRGMKVYAHDLLYECVWPGYWPASDGGPDISSTIIRNFTACLQIDLFGRTHFRVCTNHPDYRAYHLAVVENQLRSYPIEGIKINAERNGPLSSVLVGNYAAGFSFRKPQAPACFCPHCLSRAREIGIDVARARQGWMELLEFSERSWRAARERGDDFAAAGVPLGFRTETTPPPDGYFVTFLRILSRYPQILQWNQMWYDSLLSLYAQIYGVVKAVSPERKLGIHVWHHRAFSPFERAMYDYSEIARYADWIKPKVDLTVAGFRYEQDAHRYIQALFSDRDFDRAFDAWSTILGWEHERPSAELPENGMSLDYLRQEVQNALRAVDGRVPIYPGVGINIPAPTRTSSPDDVTSAIRTVFEAGAPGILLARSLFEMKPENVVAAGNAIDTYAPATYAPTDA